MDSELKVLKKIFEEKEKAHTKSISKYLGFSQDYIRFLCQRLVEKDLLQSSGRDWYKISQKGKRELRLRSLIEGEPKRLRGRLEKLVPPTLKLREFPKKRRFSTKIKLPFTFNNLKRKKFNLAENIEKIPSTLKKYGQEN